jgi:Spy/CpxP family protein refolding chaperone
MKTWLMTCLMLAVSVPTASAKPSGEGPEMGKRMKQRMLQLRKEVLKYEVGLEEAKTEQVLTVLRKFDPAREAIHKKARGAKRAVRRLLKSDSNDQAAYSRVIKDVQAVAAGKLDLEKKQLAALKGHLTPKQQVLFRMAMKRIMKRMKRKMREFKNIGPGGKRGHRPPRHRRGGGGEGFDPPGAPGGGGQGDMAIPSGGLDLDADDLFL